MQDPVLKGKIQNNFFTNEEELLFEINYSKLKNFGKECFQSYVEKSFTLEQTIKISAQHFAFDLPLEINEFFITPEISKYFWVSNHPLVSEIDNYSSSLEKKNIKYTRAKEELRKFYIKWATESSEKERIFFAGTIKNLIEKNEFAEDIIKYLLEATIILHESKYHSEEKFLELTDYVTNMIMDSNISEYTKSNYAYYINIYKAFFYIAEKNYETARTFLENAVVILPKGITAKFYLAIVLKMCGETDNSIEYIKNIVLFDLERFAYAIEVNKQELFQHFLYAAVSYQLFRDKALADIFPNIKLLFESFNSNSQTKLRSLNILISKLKDSNISEYFNDEIVQNVKFLDTFVERYSKEKNSFIQMIESLLFDKYYKLLDKIRENFKTLMETKMASDLDIFNKKIQNYQTEASNVQNDIEKHKDRIRQLEKENIIKCEHNHSIMIADVENALSQIDSRQDFNPFVAFNNSLVYNFIISLIVFIVGGFIDGLRDSQLSDIRSSGIILSVLISGLKWSAIIFAIGLVISLVTMLSKVIERSNEKQKLLRRITQLKVNKDKEIDLIKKETDKRIKEFEDNVKARLERIRSEIELMNKEKKLKEEEIKGEIEKEVAEFQGKLNAVFN
jgi:hypothetical protein